MEINDMPAGRYAGAEGTPLASDAASREVSVTRTHFVTAGILHDLLAVAEAFEVTGPDADGLVWLVFRGIGGGKMGAINAGNQYSILGQAALMFEKSRRAAIGKARGEA
jgi:hypothetical protein